MKYLAGYPAPLLDQVRQLVAEDKLGVLLGKRYPDGVHGIQTDRALYDYVTELKNEFMRKAAPLSKVMFDNKLHVIRNALGTHTTVSRVQGGKLKAKREIRVASLFKDVPLALLRMIVVHELAHMKERDHDKAFYALCMHMEPDYRQLEFDLRLYLTHLDSDGTPLWASNGRAHPLAAESNGA
jgi:predicted metal-dependent hydrolase